MRTAARTAEGGGADGVGGDGHGVQKSSERLRQKRMGCRICTADDELAAEGDVESEREDEKPKSFA